jgi:hypothetical protein
LQAIDGHVLKQPLRRINARAQTPADRILKLFQRDSARTALLVNKPHQVICRNSRLRNPLSEELRRMNAKNSTKSTHVARRIATGQIALTLLDVPNASIANPTLCSDLLGR